jgi:hypothetical protein
MASFTAGTTFVDGVANDVTAAKLGALITNATPTSGLIQDRTSETVIATNDTFLFGDASDSNNLKRMTVANVMKAELTGTINSTAGTITALTTGTTTSTAQVVTNGTTATFNSTTGTIANLSATTSTFLGTITGSTNVVNIGSGQIYKDASGFVGIGTASPSEKLTVYDTTSARILVSGDSATTITAYRASTDATQPIVNFKKARGTQASPSAVATADQIGTVQFQAFGGTNARTLSAMSSFIETYTSDTNISSYLQFSTSPSGSAAATEKMRIDGSGNVSIGTTSATSKLHVNGEITAKNVTINVNTLATATGTQNLDFTSEGYLTHSITGNITYTASNYAIGRSLSIRITSDATQRTLTFPTNWVFVGAKPTAIAASKKAILSVTSFGTTEAEVVASYAVQT